MEASGKHWPFDTRWPCARKDNSSEAPTAARLRAAEAAEALEWESLSNRYFHERRPPSRLRLVPTDGMSEAVEGHEREEAGTRRFMAAMAATNHERANGFGRGT